VVRGSAPGSTPTDHPEPGRQQQRKQDQTLRRGGRRENAWIDTAKSLFGKSLIGVVLNSITSGLPGLLRPLGGIDPFLVLAPLSLAAVLGSVTLLGLAARTLVRRGGLG